MSAMATIEVLDADITALEVDAITHAANTDLRHGGGDAGAIPRAGGPATDAGVRLPHRLPPAGRRAARMSRPVSGSRKRPTPKPSTARRPTRKVPDARRPAPPSARSVALDVIRRVTDEGAYSNLTLARTLARADLSDRDAAFATELVYGTLRRLIPIDHTLAPLLEIGRAHV